MQRQKFLPILLVAIALVASFSFIGCAASSFSLNVNTEKNSVTDIVESKNPTGSKHFMAVATLIKNEAVYLPEWVLFHRNMGIDVFYLYNHGSNDSTVEICKSLVRYGIEVHLLDAQALFPEQCKGGNRVGDHKQASCQLRAFKDAIERARNYVQWLGIFDIDEFLYSNIDNSLLKVISNDKYASVDQVIIKSTVWGSNGVEKKPVVDPTNSYYPLVLEMYSKRADPTEKSSIDKQFYGQKAFINPLKAISSAIHNFNCQEPCRTLLVEPLQDDLRMNHYQYKSKEENALKAVANGNRHLLLNPDVERKMNAIDDDSMKKYVRDLEIEVKNIVLRQQLKMLHPILDQVESPLLSVVFLSCKRISLLKRSLQAFVRYMAKFEPNILYEIIVWDNNSGDEAKMVLAMDLPIDVLILSSKNVGIASALNSAFFGISRAPYILSLEEDWEAKFDQWSPNFPMIQMSIFILENDPEVLEVWLRDFNYDLDDHTKNRTDWLLTPPNGNFSFLPGGQVEYKRQYAGDVWGAYTNGASLKHTSRFDSIGRFSGVNGEYTMALKVKAKGLASAHICLNTDPVVNRCDPQAKAGF